MHCESISYDLHSITLVSYERSETPLSIKVFPTLSKRRAWEVLEV